MIAYLKGTVASIREGNLVVDVSGVGYQVFISSRDAANLPSRGAQIQVYTWMSVSQDAIRLYGFLDENDLDCFRLLLNVSGVGPKAALGILSALTADELRFAVLSDDEKTIARSPGIGPKSARKIILELKDKFSLDDAWEGEAKTEGSALPAVSAQEEAVQALIALGFSGSDALRAVRSCAGTGDMDTEEILKLALAELYDRGTPLS